MCFNTMHHLRVEKMSVDNSPFDVKNVCIVFQGLYETNTFTQ